ncbi:MAG: pantoate--beta-alanine ligase [Halorhodospira halophila]|uniref:pantoate--beta-alanine ligase n=1 Tax=Halorhodospira TaxID=85108 RepID=UPI002103D18C|nr:MULTISPECIES: pantoate--beta-alanine ligase [Halorhodospira]MCC3751156.1 pantoate--beta-alanine ligase [Halorhodospira halophila]MCG5537419.1 pantoate--beta-alanine ligase [Halorhodospira sp. 9622]
MRRVTERNAMRELSRAWRGRGERVGLVPTMGNLHRGHLELVDRLAGCVDRLVVSIFVNPLQFGPGEDYDAYPRTLDADLAALQGRGVDAVFAPTAREMYPGVEPPWTGVDVPALTQTLCGAARPGHFAGVAVVVIKLLNIVEPDAAAFGRKDYQQLQVVRRVVADLDLPVEIVEVPVVREGDGLALSSRNGYLDAEQRRRAPALYVTLRELAAALEAGRRDWQQLEAEACRRLEAAGFDAAEYVAVRRCDDLAEPRGDEPRLVCLGAARLGTARLIDNVEARLNR